MKHYAIVLLALAAVLGAAATAPLPLDQRITIAAAMVVLAFVLGRTGTSRALRALVLLTLVCAAANAWWQRAHEPQVREMRTARYTGMVLGDEQVGAEEPGTENASISFICALDGGRHVLVSAFGKSPPLGARVLLRGRLEPFDEPRNPGEPSQREIERERGLEAHLASAQILRVLPAGTVTFESALARMHGWALTQLRTYLPEPQASVVSGELWGERSAMPPELHDEFQETGTVHILVTAGLHLGVVAALIVWLLQLLYTPRVVACTLTIACAWCYAVFSGAHEPAVRAATMLTFALIARACGRKALSWSALGAAGLLFAFLRPLEVTGASFLLSFSCVGAIFATATPIAHWLKFRFHVTLPERVQEAIALAIATQIGTWPLTAAIFLQFSTYSILANILIVPVVGCTMLLAGAQLACAWLPPLAQAFANLNDWCLTWILSVVHITATLPNARIPMTPAPAWCIVFYDIGILVVPLLWKRRCVCVTAIACAVFLVLWPPRIPNHNLRITVLDVGQADAIVVQTPNGHTLLVDTGGQLERSTNGTGSSTAERVGERIVVPFLLRHGIHAVETILITHPHGDHVGGCFPVLSKLHVGEIADSGQQYSGNAYHHCIDTARAEHIQIVYPRAGIGWKTDDGVSVFFIGPQLPFLKNTGNDINDNSIAFILQYRHFRMLFTGDAGFAAEQCFLYFARDFGKTFGGLHVDVLKVGHHGSAYSSSPEFLAAVHPRYAIISVGRHNHFGHPAPRTIVALQHVHAQIYRTDQNAAVMITTNGNVTNVESMIK